MARDVIVGIFDAVDVKSGASLEKDLLGNVTTRDTENIGSAWDTVGGTACGALLGGLVGQLAGPGGAAVSTAAGPAAAGNLTGVTPGVGADFLNWGVKQDYLDSVSSLLLPGKLAVVAKVEEGSTAPVDTTVARYGGILFSTPIEALSRPRGGESAGRRAVQNERNKSRDTGTKDCLAGAWRPLTGRTQMTAGAQFDDRKLFLKGVIN